MMSIKALTCLVMLVAVHSCQGVKFTRCELVSVLEQNGFPKAEMRNWVCLVEASSGRDTSLKTAKAGGTFYWGLFQLDNPTWCTPGAEGGTCKVKCEDLITDNIAKASTCASTVYKQLGFTAWPGWTSGCQATLPDITVCTFLNKLFKSKL